VTTVLVTGAAGFIGSHTAVELLQHGYDVVVVDNYSNSSPLALDRVSKITNRGFAGVYTGDIRDRRVFDGIFDDHAIDAVIHFAAKKAVGESTQIPLEYYDLNVGGTVSLLSSMRDAGVRDLVFSSSCSLYGLAKSVPLREDDPLGPVNPYARSKFMCEQILADTCERYPDFRVISLRYFNPIGAHESGLLGEDPLGVPNNVLPYMAQVAVGRLPHLTVFGDDYNTPDGTGVRDYIHVVDVADGHRVGLDHFGDAVGMQRYNLGTGVGTSVLELAAAFGAAAGQEIPIRITGRRPGDVDVLIADAGKVGAAWGWSTKRDLSDMVRDAWQFQKSNPLGYQA
jgi:UDP-glucose 4-epimerase